MPSAGYYSDARRVNKQNLLAFIQSHTDISLEKALGLYSLQTGLKVSTLRIYLDELKIAGVVD